MSRLNPDQFARVEALYFEAERLPAGERDSFLAQACGDDPLVRSEVREMLRHAAAESMPALAEDAAVAIARRGPDASALLGVSIGAYRVAEILGQGGMGVVYRAHDSRLERGVAIKALPPAFAADPARMSRFMREARILASLSHPAIATVFDLAEHGDSKYLVMELIDGRTLADALADGPMRIEEALAVCAAIAAALEAAHEAGVVHRDLKPQNVMLTEGGKVKVLDFGLAREFGLRGSGADDASTVHMTHHRTREGAVLGTPGYMSPEQVRGQSVDRRTDVFALGCILYECLTGRVAFAGDTAADVAAGVLEREPEWNALAAATPLSVRRLLVRCTMKEPAKRQRDMGDLRLELEEALAAREWLVPVAASARGRRGLFGYLAPWLVAAAIVTVVITLRPKPPVGLNAGSTQPAPTPPVRRFAIKLPGDRPQSDIAHVRIAISRDGGKIALSAAMPPNLDPAPTTRLTVKNAINAAILGHPQLWVRGRDDYDFRPIVGTDNAYMPSFSPDGDWVIYHDDRIMMKKRLSGGNAVAVTEVGGYWGAYSWGTDDLVTYVPVWGKGIARIHSHGGKADVLTTPEYARKEFAHAGPCVTPDNKFALFTVWNGADDCRIEGVEIATRRRIYDVVEHGTSPRVARTPIGNCILYENNGNLFAAPFDVATLRRTAAGTVVADGVLTDDVLFSAAYDVADDGTLAYVPGPSFVEENRLAWVSREDRATSTSPFNDDRYSFGEPHFTADGSKLSVIVKGKTYRVHIYDNARGTFDPILTEGDIVSAAISPDGRYLAYSCNKDGPYSLWVKRLADGRSAKMFDDAPSYQVQIHWSPDSRHIAFSMASRIEDPRHLFVVDAATALAEQTPSATLKPKPFAVSHSEERCPRFSPNGKWIAYSSNQSGTRDVFLRNFPGDQTGRQVTVGGGDWPDWSPDGKRLYYRNKGRIYSVPVSPEDGTVTGRPTLVYDKHFGQSDLELQDYTIDPKGQILLVEPSERGPTVRQVNVVQNWWRALEK